MSFFPGCGAHCGKPPFRFRNSAIFRTGVVVAFIAAIGVDFPVAAVGRRFISGIRHRRRVPRRPRSRRCLLPTASETLPAIRRLASRNPGMFAVGHGAAFDPHGRSPIASSQARNAFHLHAAECRGKRLAPRFLGPPRRSSASNTCCSLRVGRYGEKLRRAAMVAGHIAADAHLDRGWAIALLAEAGEEAGDFFDARLGDAAVARQPLRLPHPASSRTDFESPAVVERS